MAAIATVPTGPNPLQFPVDYKRITELNNYSGQAWKSVQWLTSVCGLTRDELDYYNFGWSEERGMLVFPVYANPYTINPPISELRMWQGRYFGNDKRASKYVTYGPKDDILYYVDNAPDDEAVILVEDICSAIKVGRHITAMPLFGSSISLSRIRAISTRYSTIGFWLDPDKRIDSIRHALRASQYVNTFVVESADDPKVYRDEMIAQFIASGRQHSINKVPEGALQLVVSNP